MVTIQETFKCFIQGIFCINHFQHLNLKIYCKLSMCRFLIFLRYGSFNKKLVDENDRCREIPIRDLYRNFRLKQVFFLYVYETRNCGLIWSNWNDEANIDKWLLNLHLIYIIFVTLGNSESRGIAFLIFEAYI